jgi:gliding motility-associated-like protein
MPSDDYWFVVEYTEEYLKKYKSHFSLKDKNKKAPQI